MADVTSKNRYELLGNDPDEDSDQGSKAPTRAIDKTLPRSGKRVPGSEPVARASEAVRGGRGGRRGGQSGSEAAFNDSGAGSRANRARPSEEGGEDRAPRGRGARSQRGGRGGTFKDSRDDRHSKGLPNDHQKQANQSWGGPTGNSELADERAGEAIAQSEAVEGGAAGEGDADAEVEEDSSKTYDDYLAEQEAKRAVLGRPLAARKANEGSKQDKKWAEAKALHKDEEESNYMAPQGGKTGRQRERKERQVVEIDHRFVEQPRERGGHRGGRGGRGGRGDGEGRGDSGGRGGGRGRGDFRGGRGGEGRGDFRGGRGGEGRGDFRGGRGGEGRGDFRGGRGRGGASVNVSDTRAFPSLGS